MKLYTPLINQAMTIAYQAHHGQVDTCGVPYLYHSAAVAAQMDTEEEIVTALLHDVIEDTAVTLADLELHGIPSDVLEALKLLTHEEGVDYTRYLLKIASNPLARKVKMADIAHNSDASRNATLPAEAAERYWNKYENAKRILEQTHQ